MLGAAALVTVPAGDSLAAKQSQVMLRPAAGAAGTVARLTGRGFPAGSRVTVETGRRRLAVRRAGRRGRFTATIRVPGSRLKQRWLVSVGGGRRVASLFRLSEQRDRGNVGEVASSSGARVRWRPLSAVPGAAMRFSGLGFRPRERLAVSLAGEVERARSTRRGRFAMDIPAPARAGRHVGTVRTRGRVLRLIVGVRRAASWPSPSPSPSPPPVRDSGAVIAGAGDIAASDRGSELTAKLLDRIDPDVVYTVGDNAYPDGAAGDYTSFYEPSWGRHKAKTRPTPGNHDYHQPGAGPYFDYFGLLAGERGKGYYAYSLGSWRLYALNSNIQMEAGSPQETWLRIDLFANRPACVLAYWHHPRFSAGEYGDDDRSEGIWRALYDANAEVVLTGHDHNYQRYAPMRPGGGVDWNRGIRQFVVGTGGNGHYPLVPRIDGARLAGDDQAHGVLKLTLSRHGYNWRFIPEPGMTLHRRGLRRLPLTAITSGLVIAALAALAAPMAAGAPRVTLAPAAGPPGSVAVLRGADFAPRSRVVIHRGSRAVSRPLTNRRGRFRRALAIPAATGRRSLTIRVGSSQRLTTVFRLDPRASPTSVSAVASRGARLRWGPTAGPVGTRMRLAATGLRPGTVARVSFQRVRRRARVGRRGRLSIALNVAGGHAKPRGVLRAASIRLPFSFRIAGQAPTGDPPPPGPPGGESSQPQLPVRGFFYYPWFPETWGSLADHTRYHPSLSFYDSGSPEVIRRHLNALQYAHAEVAISSWWDRGDRPDIRLPALLQETSAAGSALRWSVYYEPEGYGDPSVDQIRSDLAYLRDRYAGHPAFFRSEDKFVVFVYADASDGCTMAERWKQANTVGAHVVLKVFPGYGQCPSQPDGWHQYSAGPETSHGRESFTVSPGFWKWDEQTPRAARDVDRFRQNVRNMVASGARYQLVISFNEWGEGTAVESAHEWSSPSGYGSYLDALHDVPGN